MSELTDDELLCLEGAAQIRRNHHSTVMSVLVQDVERAITELRSRRALDLGIVERIALRCLHDRLVTDDTIDRYALSVLDRLLNRGVK
jgi:hypothetical protein